MGEAILDRIEQRGEQRMLALTKILFESGRFDDMKRMFVDEAYRAQLIDELVPSEGK